MESITRSIISTSTDPSFNLAAEEYLLREIKGDINFFYINNPCIIIGKHQNALAEVDLNYLFENDIPLFRRLSGGGTVYHDKGNLNFCFIHKGSSNNLINFKKATTPVVKALNMWGIPVYNGERNELLIGKRKISGNAGHVFKQRVMHHGTLLFNSNLEHLSLSLNNSYFHYKDKAVKSVRSEVMNISEIFNEHRDSFKFLTQLEEVIRNNDSKIESSEFTAEEILTISKIQKGKYQTKEWNYYYGPAYAFIKSTNIADNEWSVNMEVSKGIINELSITLNGSSNENLDQLVKILEGCYHHKGEIIKTLRTNSNLINSDLSVLEFSKIFF